MAVIERLFWQLGTRFSGELAFTHDNFEISLVVFMPNITTKLIMLLAILIVTLLLYVGSVFCVFVVVLY